MLYVNSMTVSARHLLSMFQVHPIAAVEIEVSPWEYGEEAKKGTSLDIKFCWGNSSSILSVIATAEELGIAVIAYSCVSR